MRNEEFLVDYYPPKDDSPRYEVSEDPRAKNVVEIIKEQHSEDPDCDKISPEDRAVMRVINKYHNDQSAHDLIVISPSGNKFKVTVSDSGVLSTIQVIGGDAIEGDGQEYYTLAPTALTFRSTEPLDEFQEVRVNGEIVDSSNYTLEEGSTIVTLSIDYLKTLGVGNYDINIVSDNNTVSGGFTVAAPNLNEYGFYYNQPYTAYVDMLGCDIAFFLYDNGIVDVIAHGNAASIVQGTYAYENGIIMDTELGVFTFAVSNAGLHCNELYIDFVLNNESIVSDGCCVYVYEESLGGYNLSHVANKEKTLPIQIRTNINNLPTVAIENYAFMNCNNLTSIKIPNSVIVMYRGAFSECKNLESVFFENGSCLDTIPADAFIGCENLTDINIPNSVTSIGNSAFSGCIKLQSIILPDNLCQIDNHLFNDCVNLKNVVIPSNVNSIDDSAFYACTSLESIVIPNSVLYIAKNAFNTRLTIYVEGKSSAGYDPEWMGQDAVVVYNYAGQSGITSDGIKWALKNDETIAIAGCTQNVTELNIPSVINGYPTYIEINAFENVDNITKIIIMDGITEIPTDAFNNCVNLTSVIVPDSVTSIGYFAFYNCENLVDIRLSNNITAIPDSMCNLCKSLSTIVIPDYVTEIGSKAFYDCRNLKSVTIPSGVTFVGADAFRYCTSLTNVIFNGTISQWNSIVFDYDHRYQPYDWNINVPATHVQCSDGQVAL